MMFYHTRSVREIKRLTAVKVLQNTTTPLCQQRRFATIHRAQALYLFFIKCSRAEGRSVRVNAKDASAYCRDVTRQQAKNFYYAFLFCLAPREAIYAVYAFCRYCGHCR